MNKVFLFLFILFLFPIICFGAVNNNLSATATMTNSGNTTIFKIRVSGLQSGQIAVLNIGVFSDEHKINPVLIAQKAIQTSDLDAGGNYTYIYKELLPMGVFKPVANIKIADTVNNSPNYQTNSDEKYPQTPDEYGKDCINDVCFSVKEIYYKWLAMYFDLQADNVVKYGLDCYANGSDILEGGGQNIPSGSKGKITLTFQKKYPEKDYVCNPYIVTSGFLGIKTERKGKKILYPAYPIVKTKLTTQNFPIAIAGYINTGVQNYYASYVIKEGKFNGNGNTYCLYEKKQNDYNDFISIFVDPRANIKAYVCNKWFFPILDSPISLKMKNNQLYSIGVIAKGEQNQVLSGLNSDNFVEYTYISPTGNDQESQNISITSIKAEADSKNKKIYLYATAPSDQNVDDKYFYVKISGKNDKYKLAYSIGENVLNDGQIKYTQNISYPSAIYFNEKTKKNSVIVFSANQKYIFGFCGLNGEKVVCRESSAYSINSVAQTKYSGICTNNVNDGAISVSRAKLLTETISADVGVRKQLLMAILMQETNLGKNMGDCTFNTKGKYCITRSSEDTSIFQTICKKLNMNWLTAPVSCKQDEGEHGCAMGLSQMMQKEWLSRELRIRDFTKRATASPWNHCDAIFASAMFLLDNGARAGGYGESGAIIAYNPVDWYLGQVQAKVRCLENSWGDISAMTQCENVR